MDKENRLVRHGCSVIRRRMKIACGLVGGKSARPIYDRENSALLQGPCRLDGSQRIIRGINASSCEGRAIAEARDNRTAPISLKSFAAFTFEASHMDSFEHHCLNHAIRENRGRRSFFTPINPADLSQSKPSQNDATRRESDEAVILDSSA